MSSVRLLQWFRETWKGFSDGVVPLNRETAEILHQETHLLSRLVSDLRELSLAEAGQLKLYRVPTDLAALLHQCASKMASQAWAKGVSLVPRVLVEALPSVDADPDRISQVVTNLLGNALRYTFRGGCIILALEQVQDGASPCVRVSVADTGSGISPEDLPHIFDRFYRADRSHSRSTGGSGLGLAIVKQLIEAHGGRAWAQSHPGQGATVCFTLPIRGPASK